MVQRRLEQPIFLMCSERSGSNLIAKLFDAHPQFAAPGTSHLLRIFSELGCRYEEKCPELRDDILRAFDAKVASWLLDTWTPAARRALLDPAEGCAGMIASLLDAERRTCGKPRLFVKENSIHEYLPFVERISIDPAYLFMVRDPRDVALSWLRAPLLRGGVVRAARRWRDDQEGSLRALRWLPPERRRAFCTYEQLITDPERTLRRVCEALEVECSDAMLDFHRRSRSARADADRAAVWANLSKPILGGNHGKYVGGLEDDAIAFVESLCGSLMRCFGYERHRSADRPEHGSHPDLDSLTRALEAREPWDKPAYLDLPAEERARFEHWSTLSRSLHERPFSAPSG